MRQRALGKTGRLASALGLGTFALSGDGYGEVADGAAEATIRRALELGIRLFDTADAYGAGRMEALLGELLRGRDDALIVTKGGIDRMTDPPRRRFEPEYLAQAIDRSRKRLQRDVIDVYLLHNPSEHSLTAHSAIETLLEHKARGHIAHVGISTGRAELARLALERGAEVISVPYNLLHVCELNSLAGDLLVQRPGVLSQSPLSYGLLSGLWREERSFEAGDHRSERWSADEIRQRAELVDKLRFLVRDSVRTSRAAALRFCLANDLISSVLLGPKSVMQLDQLVRDAGAGPTYLPEADLKEVMRVLERAGVPL